MSAEQVVTDFCDAWSRADVDAIVAAFTDDAHYHNVPLEPLDGKPSIEAFIRSFFDAGGSVVFETHRQVAAGGVEILTRYLGSRKPLDP